MREIAVFEIFAACGPSTIHPSVAAILSVQQIIDGETEVQCLEHFLLPFVTDASVGSEVRVEAAGLARGIVKILAADILPLQTDIQVLNRNTNQIQSCNQVGGEGNVGGAEIFAVIAAIVPILDIVGEVENLVSAQGDIATHTKPLANLIVGAGFKSQTETLVNIGHNGIAHTIDFACQHELVLVVHIEDVRAEIQLVAFEIVSQFIVNEAFGMYFADLFFVGFHKHFARRLTVRASHREIQVVMLVEGEVNAAFGVEEIIDVFLFKIAEVSIIESVPDNGM